MNDFAVLGLTVFLGIVGGKIVEKTGIPELVGMVLIGLFFGESALGLLPLEKLDSYRALIDLALAFFGFFIGSELIIDELREIGREIVSILVFEVIFTFLMVTAGVYLYTRQIHISLLFGALATSTAPAATADVVWEYKSKGKLTTTILALVGLDDVASILAYSFASNYVISSLKGLETSLTSSVSYFAQNIGLAIILGLTSGAILTLSAKLIRKRRDLFVLAIGAVILCSGAAELVGASEILSTLILGIIFANFCLKAGTAVDAARELIAPLFTVFFVLTGARLNIYLLSTLGLTGIIYLFMRILGKTSGSTLGAFISDASGEVKGNIGLCLYSQAGIALGLSSHLYYELKQTGGLGAQIGLNLLNTVISTTMILLIIGPILVKYALARSGEMGKVKRNELIFEE